MTSFTVRRARTSDVKSIRELVKPLANDRVLLEKEAVAYYENLQEFFVAEDEAGAVIGCGGLHVMWEDIAEVRTLATDGAWRGKGVGHQILDRLLAEARELGVARVFCLTFEVDFFLRHGFSVMEEQSPPSTRRSTPNCCVPPMRAWPSSWTWRGSSPIRWATPG